MSDYAQDALTARRIAAGLASRCHRLARLAEEDGKPEQAATWREHAAGAHEIVRTVVGMDLRPPRARSMFDVLGIEPPPDEPLDLAEPG